MRRLIVLGSLVVAIVVFLPFAGFLTARNVTSSACDGDGISQPIIPGPIPDVPGLTDGQVRLAMIIWLQVHKLSSRLRGLTPRISQRARVGATAGDDINHGSPFQTSRQTGVEIILGSAWDRL